ncbi:hypothetical protein [Pedobacter africanus]|uniref:hypothetical protein n=1 Tax=Pedobacter africanus TaxID=151894 RepID=UPI0033978E25
MNDDDIHIRLGTLLEQQQELLTLTRAIHTKLPLINLAPAEEEVWLTRKTVMELLYITRSTFFRRKNQENWTRKKIGKSWYYLKSSVLGGPR